MRAVHNQPYFNFLAGGGEMGHMTRTYNWASTLLGTPDTWPQSLRTTLTIILHSKFPMFLFWGREHLCFYNDAYRPSLGSEGKHPRALGQPGAEVWPEIWDVLKPMIDTVLSGGESIWQEDQLLPIYRNAQMESAYWTYSYSAVHDESGKPAGVFVNCMETTEKVINLNRLAESKNQFHFAIEAAQLATWDYNPATNTFLGNERLKEWFGLPSKAEIDLSMAVSAIAEKDRDRAAKAISAALEYASGGEYDIEYTIIHPVTGVERIVRAQGKAWFGEDRVAYRFNGTIQDVTQQVLARQELEAEKQLFHALLETIPNITWTSLPSGEVNFFNRRWYEFTGLTFDQTRDWGWEQVLHPDDYHRAVSTYRQALASGEVLSLENRYRRADGQYRWHLIRAMPLLNEEGKITLWVGTLTDIHAQKQLEAELDQQVRLRTQQLEASIQELQRSNQNLQQFAYVASHDLQEPLRKIQSFGDILKNKFGEELGPGLDYLDRMQNAASRMSLLINDLLIYSRISTRREANATVSLAEVVQRALSDLEIVIQDTAASVTIEPLPTILGDALQLGQLFTNLLSNALKFRQPHLPPVVKVNYRKIRAQEMPKTTLAVKIAAQYHQISVADQGIGFEEQYHERIFEVFQRLHGRSQYEGTGIGLAICKKVAENHGGAIFAFSQPGKGATFQVYFPILKSE